MDDLPNQSPRKSLDSENEKTELLNESRKLARACKVFVFFMQTMMDAWQERMNLLILFLILDNNEISRSFTVYVILHVFT